jgi:SOS response regulatory protein OraA/RecX
VRRRRLRDKDKQKALASLARQGFSYGVAKRALEDDEPA